MAKILVVDDEPAIRITLEDILQRDGHKVVSAKNGATALQLIATDRFDVALLDLNLGDMRGTEVLAALRRLAANRELVDPSHQALATMKISGGKSWMVFFSTHPPIESRIRALENAR